MRRIGLAVLGLALSAASLAAQHPRGLREVRHGGAGGGGSVGIHFLVAEPLDTFARTGQGAFGVSGSGLVAMNRTSTLGLRIEGTYQNYESDYRGFGISTSSSIGSLAVGPQITVAEGPIRPYAFATFGGSLFWSAVSDEGDCGCYDSDVDFVNGKLTTATQLGAGVQFLLSRRFGIDVGVRDLRHAQVRYVPVGGITENPDGSFTVQRVETPVRQRVFQLGLTFGIR